LKGPPLNKNALLKEQQKLKIYHSFLPSLERKRLLLMARKNAAKQEMTRLEAEIAVHREAVSRQLPMMADEAVVLDSMVQVEEVKIEQENIVGLWLPKLVDVRVRVVEFALWGTPHWLEVGLGHLEAVLRWTVALRVQSRRLGLLEEALRKTTQRVNLFEQVLIPRAEADSKRIRLFLAEGERSAVIRSKIAKAKRASR
jgi:V/A-type H+-transporting ATPase subunit D